MNKLIHDLFLLMDCRSPYIEQPACHAMAEELEQLEATLSAERYDAFERALLAYASELEDAAFRLGLRLGLQLHSL